MRADTKHRLVALAALVVLGIPAFLIGGVFWVSDLSPDAAVARFRAGGPRAAEAVPGLPEPGVYRYRTTGGERVSLFDYQRRYSRQTTRIVTRRGCGVREEQWFLIQHVEWYDRCGPRLTTYGTDIAYWWTHGTQDFRCDGGSFDGSDLRPGETSTWTCRDEDTTAAQTTEYVNDEEVVVGGRPIMARRTRWRTIFSGATVGSALVEDWFDPVTNLVLRERRSIGLTVGSPFVGRLSYVDISAYDLVSTVPER